MPNIFNFSEQTSLCIYIFIGLLFVATLIFESFHFVKPNKLSRELQLTARSWWVILVVFILLFSVHPIIATLGVATLAVLGHKEILTHLSFQNSNRNIIWLSYLVLIIQFGFAFIQNLTASLILIPVIFVFALKIRNTFSKHSIKAHQTTSMLHWSLIITAFSLSHLILLEGISADYEQYLSLLFFLVFISQTNDIFQYIAGTLFGKHKLAPLVSPNKTVEGLIGGIIGSLFLGYCFSHLVPMSVFESLVIALVISVTGLLGDLNMSAFKRSVNIKDMSQVIPGHGGIMDRLDSLSFSAVAYFYMLLFWVV